MEVREEGEWRIVLACKECGYIGNKKPDWLAIELAALGDNCCPKCGTFRPFVKTVARPVHIKESKKLFSGWKMIWEFKFLKV